MWCRDRRPSKAAYKSGLSAPNTLWAAARVSSRDWTPAQPVQVECQGTAATPARGSGKQRGPTRVELLDVVQEL